MLRQLAIKNFKSIGEPGIELWLKPLTILVGPNGSGKSSTLEALYFFRGAGLWDTAPFSLDELVHRQDMKNEMVVRVLLTNGTGFQVSKSAGGEKIEVLTDDGWWDHGTDRGDKVYQQLRTQLPETVFFISALRGEIPREAPPPEQRMSWPRPKGEGLVDALNRLNEPENLDTKRKVERWAAQFGLKDLWSGPRRQSVTTLYRDMGALLPVISASYGARQILSVITSLFYCPQDSVFLIEEPEISLHPEAQVKLVEMFAEAVREDKQIIITTHSHYLLLALTEAVQRQWLKSDDVCIWEITKEEEMGTVAKQLPITEEGIIQGWVSSFARVDAALLKGRARQTSKARR